MANTPPTPRLQSLLDAEPDLVDRIFEYLIAEVPAFAQGVTDDKAAQLKNAVRAEFAGDRVRVGARTDAARRDLVRQVLTLFNGRNASEVARRLQISRPTVYRYLKQAGDDLQKESQPGSQ